MSSSVIRKITRGVNSDISSTESDISISCSITNPDKVIVLLDSAYGGDILRHIYLKSVSTTNIVINGYISSGNRKAFSYQIIEFM